MNEVRSTNELAASPPRRGLELEVSKPIVLLQKKSKRQETSVFDGMRHVRPVHDALKRRLRETDGLAICRSGSKLDPRGQPRWSIGESKRFGGQASKSIRWMPWHQEAMKDVVKLR